MTDETDNRLLLLAPQDNVYVLRDQIEAGETIMVEGRRIAVPRRIGLGHKLARAAIAPGDKVLKYGAPIGSATAPIGLGEHVHTHNVKSDYTPTYTLDEARREHGDAQ
ncbi:MULTISPECIES: UxaA family hydrolase [unclassified Roseitalea]|uniref:UxaA family hydrolase n=1 Tax=unclassified Roseitalea TaxID=2639107 RepID=UPI00273DB4F6|nr:MULTISPECIES: UxaA family hydrolase [unclassified Roseitalea]